MKTKDALGDRMKQYECTAKFLPRLPIIVRLDGRSFSRLTKGLNRPFDRAFHACMIETTEYLIEQTGAILGYTQSDEITLCLYYEDYKSQQFFDGKVQKLVSTLSALATVKFNQVLGELLPEKAEKLPTFDCRCFVVPTKDEACNAFLWRELDATKNAISMVAHHHFGHHKLQNKTGNQKQEMLWKEKGINFNDLPAWQKRGTFMRRVLVVEPISPEILAKIPEDKRPENGEVRRGKVMRLEVPQFSKVTNRVGFVFEKEDPQTAEE